MSILLPKYKGFNQEKRIGEYTIFLPDPPDLKLIANKDLPQEKQKFQRTLLPPDIQSWDSKSRFDFEAKEWKKRTEGYWFWNNGNLEYITGSNYLFINWWTVEGGIPIFTDAQRDLFLLWKFGVADNPKARGLIFLTARRFGKSHVGNCLSYDTITQLPERQHGGMQSKSNEDAKKLFAKMVLSWKYLPYFFKPVDSGESNPSTQLQFRQPSKRDTKNQKKEYGLVLNSFIDFENSKEVAYDGSRLEFVVQDEIGKDTENDVYQRIQVIRECVMDGDIIGKIFATSTVEELEKGGGANCKLIWDESSPESLMPNGETQIGLLRYFNPAYYGDRKKDERGISYVDAYGYTDQIAAKQSLLDKRAAIKTTAALLSERRKYPIEINDCFITANKNSPFDLIKIEQQKQYNDTLPQNILMRGNFIWKDGMEDTIVEWVHDPSGKWLVSWLPKFEDRNKMVRQHGERIPNNTEQGCIGLDPYDNKTTVDGRKSDAAAYVFRKFDPMAPYESGIFVAEYVNRPPLPEIMWEDMIKMSVFYGFEILIESNKIGTINHFRRRGYDGYLMRRPAETQTEYSKAMEEPGIPLSGDDARMSLIYATESHIIKSVGLIQLEGEQPYNGKCYFNTLLDNWEKFDFEQRWTKFDSMVGAGLALLGSRKYVPKKKEIKTIDFFQRYNNSGMQSTPLKK